MDKTVSVIIPAYNAEASLSYSIESALSQTLKPQQIIVINDGSTDGTERVAQSYGNKIIYLKQENAGQGAARNAGLSIAKGNFIAFLDADDYWLPDFLNTCVDFLLKHEEAVAVSTGLIVKMFNGREIILPSFLNSQKQMFEPYVIENFFQFWAEHDHVRTGSNIIRRDVIQKAGFQRADLRVSQDLEYWGYIATFGKWGFIPEPLWVGNSRAAAAEPGWLKKYKKRRQLCPTVEAWQKRIIPRLKVEEVPYFERVRGRVAAGYAHNKILSGDYKGVLEIVRKYGFSMPSTRLTKVLRIGIKSGYFGWLFTCFVIRLKETVKSWRLRKKGG